MFSKRLLDFTSAVASCQYIADKKKIDENEALRLAFKMLALTRFQGGIVYVIGNGGSAAIASNFSMDLIKSLQVPSQTLFDSNLVTCLSNDLGYEKVFSYPLEKLLKRQDLLVAISSSGKSSNIVKAAETALSRTAKVITLSGFSEENPLRQLGHLNFWIDRADYGMVETAHFFLLRVIIDLWNTSFHNEKEQKKILKGIPAEEKVANGIELAKERSKHPF